MEFIYLIALVVILIAGAIEIILGIIISIKENNNGKTKK